MLIDLWFFALSLPPTLARWRGIRYGIEFCDTGCTEYQAHARAFRPLSAQFAGEFQAFVCFVIKRCYERLWLKGSNSLVLIP